MGGAQWGSVNRGQGPGGGGGEGGGGDEGQVLVLVLYYANLVSLGMTLPRILFSTWV